jgi:hypothetical protein
MLRGAESGWSMTRPFYSIKKALFDQKSDLLMARNEAYGPGSFSSGALKFIKSLYFVMPPAGVIPEFVENDDGADLNAIR